MSTSKWSRSNGRRLLCLAATIFARVTAGGARDVDVSSNNVAKADATHQEGLFQRSPPREVAALQDSVNAGGGGNDRDMSICLLLIVRNEEWNLRSNLPLWKDVADCYVIGVDDRTTDGTMQAIQEGLGEDKQRFVFLFKFEDFSQARNAVLRSTSHHFPEASHILIADADWRPDLVTVDLSELDFHHRSFYFLIWDHTGHTARVTGWLLVNDPRLRFKYRIHEDLDTSAVSTTPSKLIGWEIRVVESDSSWHADLHGHSRTAERFRFDLQLLELDYKDDPTDLHTLFYLGITTFSFMENLVGKGTHEKTLELEKLIASGMYYFHKAIDLHGAQEGLEFVWSSIRWLAYGYQYFTGDSQEAERWYLECIHYDPTRIDCVVFLSRLYLDGGNLDDAWGRAKEGLLYRSPGHRPLDFFYIYECFVPSQAATVISRRIAADVLGEDSLEGLLTLGWYLVRHHRDHCDRGVLVDTPQDIDNLEAWFEEAVQREGLDVAGTKHLTLLNSESSLLAALLQTWGTGKKASLYAKVKPLSVQKTPETAEKFIEGDTPSTPSYSREKRNGTEYTQASGPPRKPTKPAGGTGTGGESTQRTRSAARDNCMAIVQEARARLGLDGRGGADPRWETRGALAPPTIVHINAAILATTPPSARERTGSFRALVFGGRGDQNTGDGGGLEHEELLQVISLLIQRSSSSLLFDVTYAHPHLPTLEAARTLVAGCPDELGAASGSLQFVHATLSDFLDTTVEQPFDYVDIGGPLSRSGQHSGRDDGRGGSATVFDATTLKRLGTKLAPDACLRAWAFAANPSTEILFRAAAIKTTAREDSTIVKDNVAATSIATTNTTTVTARKKTDMLLGKVLRSAFAIGESRYEPKGEGGKDASSDRPEMNTIISEESFAAVAAAEEEGEGTSLLSERKQTRATEEAWIRQVLAGGDKLGVPDIDRVLADGGFTLKSILGRQFGSHEPGEAGVRGHALIAELLEEGMSPWEVADFDVSLDLTPPLVHQFLAVWRGGDPTGITLE